MAPTEQPPVPDVLALVGPTAAGKTSVALAVAEKHGGEIVNADALQVYRGFDIGTAKPTAEEQARVPHHLVDILDPGERYSAGEFARRARAAIREIRHRGRVAVVVGGSGLYHRALFQGISPVPRAAPGVRQELRRRLSQEGLPSLYRELERLDPETAARLPPGDTQRVLRALEVAQVTDVPLSAWIARQPFGETELPAVKVGLTLPRSILYDLIEGRASQMLDRGWVEEVRGLLAQGLTTDLPAFQAIGYREIARYVLGEWSLEAAIERTVRATRRFAKRQLTWFRKEPGIVWFEGAAAAEHSIEVFHHLRRIGFGGTRHA